MPGSVGGGLFDPQPTVSGGGEDSRCLYVPRYPGHIRVSHITSLRAGRLSQKALNGLWKALLLSYPFSFLSSPGHRVQEMDGASNTDGRS
jgi:hypothetical protein